MALGAASAVVDDAAMNRQAQIKGRFMTFLPSALRLNVNFLKNSDKSGKAGSDERRMRSISQRLKGDWTADVLKRENAGPATIFPVLAINVQRRSPQNA